MALCGRKRFMAGVAAATLVLLSVASAGTATAVDPSSAGDPPAAATRHMSVPQKVLLYGDSITMGMAGHWTWRYRLWKGLQAAGTSVDFVGPMHTLWTYKGGRTDSVEYRDPNFDTDHAAVAGMTLMHPRWTMSDLAAEYRPDVVVGLLGFNDLRYGATPGSLIDEWRQQIELTREADPGVVIILGQYGQTWFPGVSTYNAGLADLASELDRPLSRVLVAQAPVMSLRTDTLDGAHPTSSGETLEARSVADALAQVGLPSAPAPADPPDDGSLAPLPTLAVTGQQVTATWTNVDFSTSEDIYVHDLTSGAWGRRLLFTGSTIAFPGLSGHTYQIVLAPVQGWAEVGTHSLPVSITVPE